MLLGNRHFVAGTIVVAIAFGAVASPAPAHAQSSAPTSEPPMGVIRVASKPRTVYVDGVLLPLHDGEVPVTCGAHVVEGFIVRNVVDRLTVAVPCDGVVLLERERRSVIGMHGGMLMTFAGLISLIAGGTVLSKSGHDDGKQAFGGVATAGGGLAFVGGIFLAFISGARVPTSRTVPKTLPDSPPLAPAPTPALPPASAELTFPF